MSPLRATVKRTTNLNFPALPQPVYIYGRDRERESISRLATKCRTVYIEINEYLRDER